MQSVPATDVPAAVSEEEHAFAFERYEAGTVRLGNVDIPYNAYVTGHTDGDDFVMTHESVDGSFSRTDRIPGAAAHGRGILLELAYHRGALRDGVEQDGVERRACEH